MAVGDDAAAAGYSLVNGASGLIRDGDLEMNRTRDYIAQLKALITIPWSIAKGGTGATTAAGARTALGLKGTITISTAAPTGGADGDIWFKYTA
jgi:hypothetical protein